jgi:hypothetical protein
MADVGASNGSLSRARRRSGVGKAIFPLLRKTLLEIENRRSVAGLELDHSS